MYEFNRTHSFLFFVTSTISGLLNLVALCIDEWTLINDVKRGLWRDSTIQYSPEFYGLEVARGVAVLTMIMAFLNWLFSLFNLLRHTKHPKFRNMTYSNAFILSNSVVCLFDFITAIVFTTFIDGKFRVLESLYIYWATFGISAAQLILAAIIKFSLKPGENQVGVSGLENNALELDNSAEDGVILTEKVDLEAHNSKSSAMLTELPANTSETTILPQNDTKKLTTVNASDENQDRGNWDNQFEYLLSMIGYAVGLGNVWRFPYLCYENGGGAFIIPYVIMLCVAGIPIFFLEVSIAQFSSYGPIKLWNICPAFRGIGMMMVMYSAFVALYYNTIIAYSIFYFFSTLGKYVPWQNCDGWIYETALINSNSTCSTGQADNYTEKVFSPADIYFKDHMQRYVPMNDPEAWELVWQIIVCLLVAWIIVFFVIIRGIKSSGKVAMFAAIFPYIVLVALFIRGVTLPGAGEGISFYIGADSDFSKLSDMNVWRKAATQIFFSLSAGWGGLHALSSYNTFNNNMVRDTFVVCIVNCCTSIFAGFAILGL